MTTVVADANLFLRFLTNDVPFQARRSAERFKDAEKGKLRLILFHFVLIEILFQLENWYKLTRREAGNKLTEILSFEWIEIENKSFVVEALTAYPQTKIDFVDVLLYTLAKGENHQILSFDKDFDIFTTKMRIEP